MSITRMLGTMWRVGREERLSRCRMLEVQKRRLHRLLEHVLSRSTFYRTYYRTHGITADKLDALELRHLPPIDKRMVMEHFDALVCDPAITRAGIERFLHDCDDPGVRYKGRYHVMHTSGSTGQPSLFVYGAADWRIAQALVGTRVLRYRPTLGRIRYAFLVKSGGHYAGIQLAQSASRLGFKQLALSIDDPIDRTLERLQRFQPHLLGGYPSGLATLAEQQLQGNLHIQPRKIIASGEHLDGGARALIESAFATSPVNLYAASESLAIGASCPHHKGIHLFDDWHCFEIDEAPGGARGRLTLTNLYNYTQPLIRYEMTDEIELADTPCPCGWPFLLVKDVIGEPKRGYGSRRRMEPAIAFIPRFSPCCTRRVWRDSRPSRPDRERCSYASRPLENPKKSSCRSRGEWPKRCVRNTSTGISPFERRSSMKFQTIRSRASTNSSFLTALPSFPLGTRHSTLRRSPCG